MPDKDKVESLLKLADFSWRDYSERRSIEWKTNFSKSQIEVICVLEWQQWCHRVSRWSGPATC